MKEEDKKNKKETKILYYSFNQDCKCFLIGSENGCTIYQTDPYKKAFELSKQNIKIKTIFIIII